MVSVSGPLKIMTDKPSRVSEVWVGSPQTRPHGGGLLVEERDKVTPVNGVLTFTSVPGPVLLTLVSGGRVVDSVKGIVPDKASATLAEVVRAAGLADAGTTDTLTSLALEVAADAARVGTAAQVGVWADQAEGAASDAAAAAAAADNSASAASGSATTAATAADSVPGRVTTEINTQLPAKIDQLVPPKVAEVIGGDTVVRDAAAAAVSDAVVGLDLMERTTAEGLIDAAKWYRGPLGESHLDTVIDTGLRDQLSTPQATLAQGYPVPVRGYLVTVRQSPAIASQTYSTTSGTVPPSQWTRTTSNAHSDARTWGPWVRTNRGAVTLGTADLDTITAPDDYVQGVGSYATSARHYPETERGNLKVTEITSSHIHQVYLTAATTPRLWTRSQRSGVWEDWALVSGGGDSGGEYPGNPYAHMVRELNLRRRMGHVTTGGKAAVTIIFDHGTKNWRDIVHPALIQRGLRATLALNGSLMENGVDRWGHDASITWDTIKGWHNAGMEIANHGMYHDDAPDVASQLVEIRDSREKLEAELGVTVDSWVGAGISGTQMNGFYPVTNIGKYAEYTAGRIVLDNHAVAFGNTFTPNYTWPMDGTIPQGPIGQWLDRGDQNAWDNIVSAIDHAVATKGRTIVRCHPQYMGMPNMYDEQFLLDFLDYLKGRVDNGDLVVLTARKWAVAELGAPAPTVNDTGWRNINGLTTVWAEGDIHLIRIGNQVTMKFTRFLPTTDLGQWGLILNVPAGFRTDTDDIRAIPVNNSPGALDTLWQNYTSGQLHMSNHQDATGVWNMSASWITHDPWPSTLPGLPA